MPPVRNWRVGRVDRFAFWFRWSIYVLVFWALNAGRFRKHTRLKHSSADMLLYGSGSWRDVAQGARRSPKGAKWKITSAESEAGAKSGAGVDSEEEQEE